MRVATGAVAATTRTGSSDPEVQQDLDGAIEDLRLAADALQSGSQMPSWIGTRLLAVGNEIGDALTVQSGCADEAALAQVQDGARELGRPMCVSNQLPSTAKDQIAAELQGWSQTLSSALA